MGLLLSVLVGALFCILVSFIITELCLESTAEIRKDSSCEFIKEFGYCPFDGMDCKNCMYFKEK